MLLFFYLKIRDERPTSMETERYNGNGSTIIDDSESRPLSQTSSELDALSPLQVKYRDKPKLQVIFYIYLINDLNLYSL